jgi:aminoglycoside 6'-N-acetyltransferase
VPGPLGEDIGFRDLDRGDFPELLAWLSTPHVSEWWGEPPQDITAVDDRYGPCIDRTDPTRHFVITVASRHVGMIETYLLKDNPEYQDVVGVEDAAGLDILIGDPDLIGRGLGTEVVKLFVEQIGWPTFAGAARYMAGPSIRNIRSRRMFEKAGFAAVGEVEVPGEPDPEVILVLERPSFS